MSEQTRIIAGEPVRFFQAGGRWVFKGCRNPGGYLTVEDAEVEVRLQLNNRYTGSLNTAEVDPKHHRASVKTLKTLQAKW